MDSISYTGDVTQPKYILPNISILYIVRSQKTTYTKSNHVYDG